MGNNAEYVIWVSFPDPDDPEEGWTLEELQDHRAVIEDQLNKMPGLIQWDFKGATTYG